MKNATTTFEPDQCGQGGILKVLFLPIEQGEVAAIKFQIEEAKSQISCAKSRIAKEKAYIRDMNNRLKMLKKELGQ